MRSFVGEQGGLPACDQLHSQPHGLASPRAPLLEAALAGEVFGRQLISAMPVATALLLSLYIMQWQIRQHKLLGTNKSLLLSHQKTFNFSQTCMQSRSDA